MIFRNRSNLVNLLSVWWPRSVRTQNFLDFQKRSTLSRAILLEFWRHSCLQKACFEKSTAPSFRAYFIILIGVLVSRNYQLINDNWNGEKIHVSLLFLERRRLGLSTLRTLHFRSVLHLFSKKMRVQRNDRAQLLKQHSKFCELGFDFFSNSVHSC